jgi:hypothetical protein
MKSSALARGLIAKATVVCCGLSVGLLSSGCGSSETPEATSATEALKNSTIPEVSAPMRGTVGGEVDIGGLQPTLISGYGFVVGLKGTGGLELDERIAATIEREMGAMGIGRENPKGTALEDMTPRKLLRHPDTAVVLVQAAISPGSPEDTTFDVYVKALNATSLEGGRLWTTRLRLGAAQPFGGAQARVLGEARGAIFVNPFSDSVKEDPTVSSTSGRVLAGGVVTAPLGISLSLYNESHARARTITSVINSRFPPGEGDPGSIARGRSASMVELTIPRRYRDEPLNFIQIVRHLRIDPVPAEELARRFVQSLREEPQFADDYAWCLEAVGHKSIPFVRSLYESPDVIPRLAALRAGARLKDPTAAAHLVELAKTGPGAVRSDAISLLGELPSGPTVDLALRELLAEPELSIRVAAYEALASRAEISMQTRIRANQPRGMTMSPTLLEDIARSRLPAGMLQGIERVPIITNGFKFFLDIVPGGEPLIYVTQQGTPRIVLFGDDLALDRPASLSLWGSVFMMENPGAGQPSRIRYLPDPKRSPIRISITPQLPELVATLAESVSPNDPDGGLDMSYAEVVATLNEVSRSRATRAGFATETDRLKAALLAATDTDAVRERPETPAERDVIVFRQTQNAEPGEPTTDKPESKPTIVPIVPKDPK